jgi:hypothetical protein
MTIDPAQNFFAAALSADKTKNAFGARASGITVSIAGVFAKVHHTPCTVLPCLWESSKR